MGKQKTITGVVSFQSFGTGFWGITDSNGKQWRPVHMPDQLKIPGATVTCIVRMVEDEVSVFMWGKPVEIISFYTPSAGRK
jgi:hypothetical protein